MLLTKESVASLVEAETVLLEPGVTFSAARTWEEGSDGKRRPTGAQYEVGGVPVWQIPTRLRHFVFGRVQYKDATIFVTSAIRPDVDELKG